MSTKMMEQELVAVKLRLAELEARIEAKPKEAWRQIVGTSKGDALDREAARLGAAWRARENKRR